MQLFFIFIPFATYERPALQNKQVVVLRMTFRDRKVLGTFEKWAPGFHLCSMDAAHVHQAPTEFKSQKTLGNGSLTVSAANL